MTSNVENLLGELAAKLAEMVAAEVYARVGHVPKLSHYTSIDACKSILRSRELWFSLVRDTNDTSEAVEGTEIVADALEEYGPKVFKNYADFHVYQQFEARRGLLETDTYVLSLCEHGSDQRTDRLEMWRAYGHDGNGLCVVLNKQAMLGQKAKGLFPVHWVPIEYEDAASLGERVHRRLELIRNAVAAASLENAVPPQALGMLVAVAVDQLVLGHKNVAFEQERELRFVRSRLLQSLALPAGAEYRTITVDGQPRSKFVLQLRKYPEYSVDASLQTILDHVIIGPSIRQKQNAEEIRETLDAAGLSQVEVRLSQIPYRANRT